MCFWRRRATRRRVWIRITKQQQILHYICRICQCECWQFKSNRRRRPKRRCSTAGGSTDCWASSRRRTATRPAIVLDRKRNCRRFRTWFFLQKMNKLFSNRLQIFKWLHNIYYSNEKLITWSTDFTSEFGLPRRKFNQLLLPPSTFWKSSALNPMIEPRRWATSGFLFDGAVKYPINRFFTSSLFKQYYSK